MQYANSGLDSLQGLFPSSEVILVPRPHGTNLCKTQSEKPQRATANVQSHEESCFFMLGASL